MNLFVTADPIGSETGGGIVTKHELDALLSFGPVDVYNPQSEDSAFAADENALKHYLSSGKKYKLAHFYSGTFSKLVAALKSDGCVVTYTVAAHEVSASRAEHEKAGYPFDFPHLNDPQLFAEYTRGYRMADLVICPSTQSNRIMEDIGCKAIAVIPHGCTPPPRIAPLPKRFVVGYLGSIGFDKGLRYLLKAWDICSRDPKSGHLLLAGKGTERLLGWVRSMDAGSVQLSGFVESPSFVYNCCSVYVQPSVTEGFGIEVVEAMAHGRPVICAAGAGAADCVTPGVDGEIVPVCDPEAIAKAIEQYRSNPDRIKLHGEAATLKARNYYWDRVRNMYCSVWKGLL
jgi:glycosyltransferase involved in cell wall biosynthesis